MDNPIILDDADLNQIAGGGGPQDIPTPPSPIDAIRPDNPPPPPPPAPPIGVGVGNTDSDESGNSGGNNQFTRG
jgi:hypothetical protein